MTALVDLAAVFLNLAANPSDRLALYTVTGLQPATEVRADVRSLANGRQRVVRQAGKPRSYSLKVEQLDRAGISWLEQHAGETMCIRDDRGRKFYAAFFAVPVDESTLWNDRGDVDLRISEVSATEAV